MDIRTHLPNWQSGRQLLVFVIFFHAVIATYPYYYPYYYYNRGHQQRSTKCSYSIIVNEVSGSKCPELMRQLQNDQQQTEARAQEASPSNPRRNIRQRNPATSDNVLEIKAELKQLESEFYKEIIKMKDFNMTLRDYDQRMSSTEQMLKNRIANSTQFGLDMKLIDKRLVKQWNYIKDLEQKIMEAITNIGEVQLMLSKRLPKLGDINDKEVRVESAPKVRNCGMGDDAKYYRGKPYPTSFLVAVI